MCRDKFKDPSNIWARVSTLSQGTLSKDYFQKDYIGSIFFKSRSTQFFASRYELLTRRSTQFRSCFVGLFLLIEKAFVQRSVGPGFG